MILLFTSLFLSTFWPRPHSWLCSRQFEVLSSGYISPASSQSSSNVSAVPSLPVSALYVNAWQRPRSPSRLVIGCLRLSEFVELSIPSSPVSCTRSFVRVRRSGHPVVSGFLYPFVCRSSVHLSTVAYRYRHSHVSLSSPIVIGIHP